MTFSQSRPDTKPGFGAPWQRLLHEARALPRKQRLAVALGGLTVAIGGLVALILL